MVQFVNRFSKIFVENIYKKETSTDVKFEVDFPTVMIGDEVTVSVTLKNTSEETRAVSGRMSLLSGFYTGVPAKRLKGDQYRLELAAGEGQWASSSSSSSLLLLLVVVVVLLLLFVAVAAVVVGDGGDATVCCCCCCCCFW